MVVTTVDLAPDFFYDNVPVPCALCGSLDVAIYAYTKDDGEQVSEGRCANCQSHWFLD